MAGVSARDFMTALRSIYGKRFSLFLETPTDYGFSNNTPLAARNAANTADVPLIGTDTDNRVQVDQAVTFGMRIPLTFNLSANASLADQSFFTAPVPMTVMAIAEVHATAGNDAAAVTLEVFRDTGTQAPAGGASVMSGTFNLKGTANTVQNAALSSTNTALAVGDRLSANFTGTLTTLAGVVVTVWVTPGFKGYPAVYNMLANGSLATQTFWAANRDCVVTSVQGYWSTPGSDAGAVTIDIIKDTGTNAPGAGTTVLAGTLSVKTAANTVNTPALSATASVLQMAAGDRLAIKYTGTLTALAGVVVVVWVQSVGGLGYYGQIDPTFTMLANGSQATQSFFIADRDYELVDFSEIHSVAGTDGGAVTLDLFIDKTTNAPGAGATALSGTVNAKATANTTIVAGLSTSRRAKFLSKGDRLSLKYTGTLTTLAGVTVVPSLRPV